MPTARRTKIIATLGPASESPQIIKDLISSGVNVFRFNMKHNFLDWHEERIKTVRQYTEDLETPVGILIDLQGPEVRISTEDSKEVYLEKSGKLLFTDDFSHVRDVSISLNSDYPVVEVLSEVVGALNENDKFFIDDGLLEFKVIKKYPHYFIAEALNSGTLKHRKSFNLNGKVIESPTLSDEDFKRLDVAAKYEAEFIALSYTRSSEDIRILRKELQKRKIDARIVAKIENAIAVQNIDGIIEESDVIMIARGDLGIELPIEKITYLQKEIINKCRSKNKQVIVATQMLQSMVSSPIPTRAEAADVSNAVYDGVDAVMLSEESAAGNYPVEAVRMMGKILNFNEEHFKGSGLFFADVKDFTNAMVRGAIGIINSGTTEAHKILVFTHSGYTANVLSSYRVNVPVVAVCASRKTAGHLSLSYGVIPAFLELPDGDFTYTKDVDRVLKDQRLIKDGETVLILHGKTWHDPGKTNALLIQVV